MPSGFEHRDRNPAHHLSPGLRLPLMPSGFEHQVGTLSKILTAPETAPYAFGL